MFSFSSRRFTRGALLLVPAVAAAGLLAGCTKTDTYDMRGVWGPDTTYVNAAAVPDAAVTVSFQPQEQLNSNVAPWAAALGCDTATGTYSSTGNDTYTLTVTTVGSLPGCVGKDVFDGHLLTGTATLSGNTLTITNDGKTTLVLKRSSLKATTNE